jgi:hypothetical protein
MDSKVAALRHSGFFKSRVQRDDDEDDGEEGGVVSLLASATERKGGMTTVDRVASFEVLEMTAEQIRHSRMDLGEDGSKASKISNPDSPVGNQRSLDTNLPTANNSIIAESSPREKDKEIPPALPSPVSPLKSSRDFRQLTPSKFDASDQVVSDYYIKPLLNMRREPATPISSSCFLESSPSKTGLLEKEDDFPAAHKKGPLQQAAAIFSRVLPGFNSNQSSGNSTPEIPLQTLLHSQMSSSGRIGLDDSRLTGERENPNSIKLELTSIKDVPRTKLQGNPIVASPSTSLVIAEEKDAEDPTPSGSSGSTVRFATTSTDPSNKSNISFNSESSNDSDLQFTHNPLEISHRELTGSTSLASAATTSSFS